jgi:O-antigen ligase
MTFDRKRLIQAADWEAVAVAVALPWSTSATSILLVVWLLTVLATLDVAMVRRELLTAAGGLPVLLWLFGALGMLWSEVSWTERLHGLGGFHRLLFIPLLLAQFRRSENGVWVLYGFFVSCVAVMLASWILVLDPNLGWNDASRYGIPAHDIIAQSTVSIICAFALIWRVCDLLRDGNWRKALWPAGFAVLFLVNMMFVATSRSDLGVAIVLVVLLGWRQYGWKGIVIACVAGGVLATGSWASSPRLRLRVTSAIEEVQAYRVNNGDSDVGVHIEFLKKSIAFVRQAPLIGHGTGSIADLFRRSALGQQGAAGVATDNPHSQVFGIAIQLGLLGTAVLLAMWVAHYWMFREASFIAWVGTVVVVQNVISSLVLSHLFDFVHGWLYVFGVGVIGGVTLRQTTAASLDHKTRVDAVPRPADGASRG